MHPIAWVFPIIYKLNVNIVVIKEHSIHHPNANLQKLNKPYEVNTRSVIALREIGCGHASIKTFASCMNIKCISEPGFPKDKQNCHVSI